MWKEESVVQKNIRMTNANCGSTHPSVTTMSSQKVATAASGHHYLTLHARQSLPNFQYKGEDRSLLYAYVLSPLAGFLVNNCTPKWMAPNTITLSGLAYMIVSYLVIWYYVPSLGTSVSETLPGWIFAYHCLAMLIYQTLDNMDGKQARRTGSSSPLGLLFDHGCDAINSIFGSVNWIISLGLDPQEDALMCWGLILGPMAMFYVATWEEYYTGALILPIVNGPNEGLLGGALLSLTTAYYGIGFWQSTSWSEAIPFSPKVRNADIQVAIASLGFLQEIVIKSASVSRKYGYRALVNLVPFVTLIVTTLLIGYLDADVLFRMPRTSVHLCSGLFVEMTTQLMLDHITEEIYQPFRLTLLPMLLLILLIGTEQLSAGSVTDEFMLVYASALWTYLMLKIKLVIHEICAVLHIWCFDITTPKGSDTRKEQ
jgi:ethanolaminephosphotransferase